MLVEVKVPEVGESITEGTLVEWFQQDGDFVEIEESLFELETDKITLTITSEQPGKLHVLVPQGEKVSVGQVVATIDTEIVRPAGAAKARETRRAGIAPLEGEPARIEAPSRPTPSPSATFRMQETEKPVSPAHAPITVPQTAGPPLSPPAGLPQARAKFASASAEAGLSPAVLRMVEEFQIDPTAISGTGKGGRITKEDVVRHLQSRPAFRAQSEPAPIEASSPESPPELEPAPAEQPQHRPRQIRKPMSPLRQRIAERLVLAQQTAAILTTFNEADMTNVLAWREKHRQLFKEKYNIGLGLMSFFIKASVDALKTVPQLNAQIQGDEIVENQYYDIAVAISSDRGLVVPVIRDADRLSFAEIELAISELDRKVRSRSITLADLSGGVFTISNGGVFGSLMSTPILNPPQSGILGMHAIKKRPVVVKDEIAIRPMMYLAVSYDHRLIDGREAVTFLRRIVQCIEDPERMLLEV